MPTYKRAEQKERTRALLLDAAVTSLVEYGYARTTTQRVQDIAGVSRGALLHHFGSKAELLVAAIHHIAEQRLTLLRQTVQASSGPESVSRERVLATIRAAMSGPPFLAAMELWVAARTDQQLLEALVPAERRLGAEVRAVYCEAFASDDPEMDRIAFDSLMSLLRGIAVTGIIRSSHRGEQEIVDWWMRSV